MSHVGRVVSREELEEIAEELQRANYYPSGDYKNPEKALLAAVLQRAIVDLLRPHHIDDNRLEAERLRLWFISSDRQPWTFLWICEELDLLVDPILRVLSSHLRQK